MCRWSRSFHWITLKRLAKKALPDEEQDFVIILDEEDKPVTVVTEEVTTPEREDTVKKTVRVPGAPVLLDGWESDLSGYEQEPHLVQNLMEKGMSREQVKAARPSMDFDGRYGSAAGPWTTGMFIEAVYRSVKEKK